MKIAYHEAAEQELINEILHLESRGSGLGGRLRDAVRRAEELLSAHPEAAPALTPNLRVKRLVKFRYSMIYEIREETVFIVAFAHHRRRPMYWLDRVDT